MVVFLVCWFTLCAPNVEIRIKTTKHKSVAEVPPRLSLHFFILKSIKNVSPTISSGFSRHFGSKRKATADKLWIDRSDVSQCVSGGKKVDCATPPPPPLSSLTGVTDMTIHICDAGARGGPFKYWSRRGGSEQVKGELCPLVDGRRNDGELPLETETPNPLSFPRTSFISAARAKIKD